MLDPRFARRRVAWLSERPESYGGSWRLGCVFCASALQRWTVASSSGASSTAASRGRTRFSKWARYEALPKDLQGEHVRAHASSEEHRLSVVAYFKPNETIALVLPASSADAELLKGHVPQPADWVRAWRRVSTPSSWAAQSRESATDAFIARGRATRVEYRALQSQALIMREVVRENKRAELRAASAICYTFDDRDGFCLVRYKVDVPTESWDSRSRGVPAESWDSTAVLAACSSLGVLGVLPTYQDKSLEDFSDDYAIQQVAQVEKMIRAFCTPLDDATDEVLVRRCCDRARAVAVDGALLKVARFLKERLMPNLVIVFRDAAHALRIAAKEPLIRADGFRQQYDRLFSDKHAVLKDIQFSPALKAKLEACQNLIVSHRGTQGGGLTHILRHFSYTPIRFDSFCNPMRAYACVLLAVGLLLADVASDKRIDASKRKRAEEALAAMTEPDCMRIGLAADFAELCVQGLRRWDVDDRDPTTERTDIVAIVDRLTALFIDGYVLCDPADLAAAPPPPAAAEPRGAAPPPAPAATTQTVTQIVQEQLRHGFKLRYGRKMHVLQACTRNEECIEVMTQCKRSCGRPSPASTLNGTRATSGCA